jgi:hypothetical protein
VCPNWVTRLPEKNGGLSFSRLERLLMWCGLFLVLIYVGNQEYSAIYSRAMVQSFWASQASASALLEARAHSQSGRPACMSRSHRHWEFSTCPLFDCGCRFWREQTI